MWANIITLIVLFFVILLVWMVCELVEAYYGPIHNDFSNTTTIIYEDDDGNIKYSIVENPFTNTTPEEGPK